MSARFTTLRASGFKGTAKRIVDVDLPRVGALIGVGEDEIHAIIDVESSGSGFDKLGRPKMLFEPHVFYRHLGPGPKRDRAVSLGLAYAKWKPGNYPSDSYPRFAQACEIDEAAACKSASWGMTQILGENFLDLGYATPQAMVASFCDYESMHLSGTVALISSKGLAGKLKAHDWAGVARGWNGPGYKANRYDDKLAQRFAFWNKIPDTPYDPKAPVQEEAVPSIVPKPAPVQAVKTASNWSKIGSALTGFFSKT